MLIELFSKFRENNLTQKDILGISFDLQVLIAKKQRVKGYNFLDFKTSVFSLIEDIKNNEKREYYSILSIVPSLLFQIDDQEQSSIKKLIEIDGNIRFLLPIYHSLVEFGLNSDVVELLSVKLKAFVQKFPEVSSSLLNLAICLFETNSCRIWVETIYYLLINSPTSEHLYSFSVFLQHRSHSYELSHLLCGLITSNIKKNTNNSNKMDLFIIMCCFSHNPKTAAHAIEIVSKHCCNINYELHGYPLNLFRPTEILDRFNCLTHFKANAEQIDKFGSLLCDSFVVTGYEELLTLALLNEFDNSLLFMITKNAFVKAISNHPMIFINKIDVCSLLYSLPKNVLNEISEHIIKSMPMFPQLFDPIFMFYRKLLNRPSRAFFAIDSYIQMMLSFNENSFSEFQTQILDAIIVFSKNPLLKSYILSKLSLIISKSEFAKAYVSKTLNSSLPLFSKEVLCEYMNEDENGGISHVSPASLLRIQMSLGWSDISIKFLYDLSIIESYVRKQSSLQLALITEIYGVVSHLSCEFFLYFSELFYALEEHCLKSENQIISKCCSISLSQEFCIDRLIHSSSHNIVELIAILKIMKTEKLPNRAVQQLSNMFSGSVIEQNRYLPKIKALTEIYPDLFESSNHIFREELARIISQYISHKTLNNIDILDVFQNDAGSFSLSSEHFEYFMLLINKIVPVSSSSYNRIKGLIQRAHFYDSKTPTHLIDIMLRKTPIEVFPSVLLSFLKEIEVIFPSINQKRSSYVLILNYLLKTKTNDLNLGKSVFEFYISLEENICTITIIRDIARYILFILKTNRSIETIIDTKEQIIQWISKNRAKIEPKIVGNILYYLNSSSSNSQIPRIKTVFNQKWRSKSKWIDQALREASSSDNDNYADLEDFVVESDEELNLPMIEKTQLLNNFKSRLKEGQYP